MKSDENRVKEKRIRGRACVRLRVLNAKKTEVFMRSERRGEKNYREERES